MIQYKKKVKKNWKMRWFELNKYYFKYFEKTQNKKVLKGKITLTKETKVLYDVEYAKKYQQKKPKNVEEGYNPKYIFSMQISSKDKKYLMMTKSEEEMTTWMKEIMKICQNLKGLNENQRKLNHIETLFNAICLDDAVEVSQAVEGGANVNASLTERSDIKPLHVACTQEVINPKIIEFLLKSKAEVNSKATFLFHNPLNLQDQLPITTLLINPSFNNSLINSGNYLKNSGGNNSKSSGGINSPLIGTNSFLNGSPVLSKSTHRERWSSPTASELSPVFRITTPRNSNLKNISLIGSTNIKYSNSIDHLTMNGKRKSDESNSESSENGVLVNSMFTYPYNNIIHNSNNLVKPELRDTLKITKSPLHIACENPSIQKKVLDLLVNSAGQMAILMADSLNYDAISYLCLNNKASNEIILHLLGKITKKDCFKSRALDLYIQRLDAKTSVLEVFLEKGFVLGMLPSNVPNLELAQMLLKNNLCSISERSNANCGKTMLQTTLSETYVNYYFVEFLLKNGADPNLRFDGDQPRGENFGENSFHIACKNENVHAEIFILLMNYSVDVDARDSPITDGKSGFDFLKERKKEDLVCFLKDIRDGLITRPFWTPFTNRYFNLFHIIYCFLLCIGVFSPKFPKNLNYRILGFLV
eukprot:TRINITY_DN3298_c0_g1_i2.p1 TRINITY_DN3298_c0_g1~~TRINITY_DN3298_c0_g1_i2.p1  ORF type:complete len:645 (-),score=152.21 TRINITY_DN3298_c0_g1_i2:9-1943(-)